MKYVKVVLNKKAVMLKKTKKISTIAGIAIVISGSIGTGIFFKNDEILLVNWNSLILVILSWIIASFGIISIVVTLANISKKSQLSDLGILQWNKDFNSKNVYIMCRNFIVYFYSPFVCFGMAFYFTQSIQNAFNWQDAQWWEVFLISISIVLFFSIISGFSSHSAKVSNNILFMLKMFPILFVVVFAIYKMSIGEINDIPLVNHSLDNSQTDSLNFTRPFLAINPITGIFASLPSIFFMFDGFYKVATIQEDLNNPKDLAKIIIIGVIIMNIIYIILTIFLLLGFENGSINSLTINNLKIDKYLRFIANILVGISLLGCINMNSIMSSKIYSKVIEEGGLRIFNFINNKKGLSSLSKGNISFNIIGLLFITILSIIGGFFFMNSSEYSYSSDKTNYLYSFVDIIINWSSVLIFAMLLLPILGSAKSKKIKEKKIVFLSYISICLIGFSLFFIFIENFVNLGIMISNDYYYDINSNFYNLNFIGYKEKSFNILNRNFISTIIKNVLLILFIIIFFLPIIYKKNKK